MTTCPECPDREVTTGPATRIVLSNLGVVPHSTNIRALRFVRPQITALLVGTSPEAITYILVLEYSGVITEGKTIVPEAFCMKCRRLSILYESVLILAFLKCFRIVL